MSNPEYVILVNLDDEPLGQAEKIAAHQQARCHRAFSVFILRKTPRGDEILLQQRHPSKYHCGGLWTNTCCGHPRPGEDTQQAAQRRLYEEMGIKTLLTYLDKFHYIAEFDNGLTENEVDHVFYGYINEFDFKTNGDEVSDIQWLTIATLQENINNNPQDYTPWLEQALQILIKLNS